MLGIFVGTSVNIISDGIELGICVGANVGSDVALHGGTGLGISVEANVGSSVGNSVALFESTKLDFELKISVGRKSVQMLTLTLDLEYQRNLKIQ